MVGKWFIWRPPQFGPLFKSLTCCSGFSKHFLRCMENQDRPNPTSPRCLKCGEQPKFTTSMPDPPTGRIFHMFECQCGNRTWISEKAV
jgi:hypothetical protein